jgi:hypothetical protein
MPIVTLTFLDNLSFVARYVEALTVSVLFVSNSINVTYFCAELCRILALREHRKS